MAAENPQESKIEELVVLAEEVANDILSESYTNNPANYMSPKPGNWWEGYHMPKDRPIRPEMRKKFKRKHLAKSSAKRVLDYDESDLEGANLILPLTIGETTGVPRTARELANIVPNASWTTSLQEQGRRYGDDGATSMVMSEVIPLDSFSTSLQGENIKCTLVALVETTVRVPSPKSPAEEQVERLTRSLSESRGNRSDDDSEPWWMKEISWYEHPTEQSMVDPNCLNPLWRKWAPHNMWERYQDRRKRRRNVRRLMRPLFLPENPTSAQKLYHEVNEQDRIFRLLKNASPRTYDKLMDISMYYKHEHPDSEVEN